MNKREEILKELNNLGVLYWQNEKMVFSQKKVIGIPTREEFTHKKLSTNNLELSKEVDMVCVEV